MFKKNTKPNIHVQVLEFGRDNPGFTIEQVKERFPEDYEWIHRQINFNGVFQSDSPDSDCRYFLSFQDSFRLLEHKELQEARQSSRNALRVAIAAIVISIAANIFQVLSVQEVEVINSPAHIEQAGKSELPTGDDYTNIFR